MSRVKYTIGDEVAHRDNINHKMRVRDFLYKDKKLIYITCTWWSGESLEKDKFHSHELIPWGIAEQGEEQVLAFLKSIENESILRHLKK